MIPVYQTRFEEDGNCWAACWASLLELPLEEADHISGNNPDWLQRTNEFLKGRGLYFVELQFNPRHCSISLIPHGEFLIAGTTGCTGHKHALVVQVEHHPIPIDDMIQMNFLIVHDPLGFHKPCNFEYNLESLILPIKSF